MDRPSEESEGGDDTMEGWTRVLRRALARDVAIARRALEITAGRRLAPRVRGSDSLCVRRTCKSFAPHPPASIVHVANQYAAWAHCSGCDLRLDYFDKRGGEQHRGEGVV